MEPLRQLSWLRIVVDRLVPALAEEVRLGPVFDFERIFYSTFVTRQLPAIEGTQAQILDQLDALRNGD